MDSPHQTLITPNRDSIRSSLKELFDYRELILFLAWRDMMAQYKQTFFGVAWAVVKPVSSVLVFTLVFGEVAKLSSSGVPYPLFTLSGVVAWSFFAVSLNQSTVSLLGNTNLITKVYFPRLIIPMASLGRGLVDFLVSCVLLAILMYIYGASPSSHLIWFPYFLLTGLSITFGIGLFFSAVSVKYHDIKHAIPFFIQMWFWITPVAYGLENIPQKYQMIFYMNPMTWIIKGFRWSLLDVGEMTWHAFIFTGVFSILVFFVGLYYFKTNETKFADII